MGRILAWDLFLCLLHLAAGASGYEIAGPVFENEPADHVDFSSISGSVVHCGARGTPRPSIKWLQADGNTVPISDRLRQVATNGSLVFPSFQSEDYRPDVHSTIYRCVASNSVGAIISREVRVKAVVPHPPDIQVYHVYPIAGSTAVLRCHVPAILSDYVHVTSWIRDGKTQIDSTTTEEAPGKYMIMAGGELHILNVDTTDLGSSYQCKAANRLTKEVYLSTTAGKVFVTVPKGNVPPEITDSKPALMIKEGETALIPCATQGYPLPTTTWYGKVGGGQLHPLLTGDRLQELRSGLLIKDVLVSDSGTYVCDVTNEVGNKRVETILTVTAKLFAEIQPPVYLADLGKPCTFKCTISGNPVTNVRWLHNGKSLPLSDGNVGPTDVLRISEVKLPDKGMYQCFVSNSFQSAQATAELRLQDALPQFIELFEEKVLPPGQSISLKCVVFGIPRPQVTWQLDFNTYRKSNNSRVEERLDANGNVVSVLHIHNLNVKDAGLYQCTASNKAGRTAHASKLNVHGPPFGRGIPKQVFVAGSTVFMNCPVYGYPIQVYQWEKDEKLLPINLRQAVYPNGTLVVEKVKKSGDGGRYTCSAWNKNGQRAQVTIHVDVTAPPKITPFNFQDQLIREGMRARLQCVVSDGDLPIRIKWLKDGHPVTSDIGVSIIDLDEFSSILTISKITPKNNGNYTCMASNSAGSSYHTAILFVNVIPKITPFKFQGDHVLEGAMARLSCVVYQGNLPITIQWLKDGHPLAEDFAIEIRVIDEYSSILTIDKVSSRHSGKYTCEARNDAAADRHSAQLVVNVPPKIVPFSFQDEHLLEGMLARVSCIVSRGDLPLRIQWEKDRQPMAPNEGVTIRKLDDYSSILSIDTVKTDHSGIYTCIVDNDAGSTRYSAQLIVNVPPKWLKEPKDTSVPLDNDVMLHCQAEGSPIPVITWMKAEGVQPGNRRDVITTSDRYNLFSNGSLLIKNVEASDEGYYFCQASNGVDEGLSIAMHLYVDVPPSAKAINTSLVAKIRQNLTLICDVRGDEPLDVTWHRNGLALQIAKNSRLKAHLYSLAHSKTSELIIRATHREDTAMFACVAKNSFGEHSANISVTVQEPPDQVKKIKLAKALSRSVELSWGQPFDGNLPILGYTIEYRPMELETGKPLDSKNISVTADGTTLTIADLKPATPYQIRIFAHNKLGESNASQVLENVTAEEAPSAPPQETQVNAIDTHTVKVTWKPPKPEFHNGKLRGYRVGYKIQGLNDPWQYKPIDITNGSKDLSVTIGNLKKFTIYEFVVEAYNGPGRGPPSEPILAATAEDVPGAPPQDVRCTHLTAKKIHMTWQSPPPMSVNGILQGYRILYKPVEEWYESTPVRNFTLKSNKYTIEGLRIYTNYSLQVLAYTKAGDGVASQPIYCRTLDDFPEAPAAIMAVPTGEDGVIVAWKRPLQVNGELKHYEVYVRELDNPMKDLKKYQTPPTDTHIEIRNLVKNFRYEFYVTASTSVGEGKGTKPIIESPEGPLVAAKVVAFDDKIVEIWKSNLTLPCRAVGVPTPDQRWFARDKPIKGSDRFQVNQEGALTIYNLQGEDAGSYSCQVKNEFGNDKIVYDVNVLEPPHPPEISIVTTTLTSIEIKWTPGKNGGLKIEGYVLYYQSASIKLQKLNISKNVVTHKLENLKCGTKYQLAMSAFNRLGIGPKSSTLESSTDGGVPTVPEKIKLIDEDPNSVGLHLTSWTNNGCPIHRFIVEYRLKTTKKWLLLSETVKPEEKHYTIDKLQPATWYTLRMTAENSAGKSIAEHDFATLTNAGGTIAPEEAADQGFIEHTGLLSDWDQWIIVATVSAITGLLCMLVIICLCVKRKKRQQRRKRAQAGDPPKRNLNKRDSNGGGGISFAYLRGNPEKLRLGKGYFCKKEKKSDLMPYATSHLSNQEMALFSNHASSPTDSEPMDTTGKANGQTPQRFARPKPYQSGFRTPTHDPYSRGMRVPHPVPIPTAPPMPDTASIHRSIGPPPNFDSGQLNSMKSATPIKSNSKYLLREFKGDAKTSETTFVFPPPFQDVCSSASGNDVTENSYENVPSGPPHCPTNIPPRPKLTFGLSKLQ